MQLLEGLVQWSCPLGYLPGPLGYLCSLDTDVGAQDFAAVTTVPSTLAGLSKTSNKHLPGDAGVSVAGCL